MKVREPLKIETPVPLAVIEAPNQEVCVPLDQPVKELSSNPASDIDVVPVAETSEPNVGKKIAKKTAGMSVQNPLRRFLFFTFVLLFVPSG